MNCDKFQEFLPDMLLDPARAAVETPTDVRAHLAECVACKQTWEELQKTMQALDAWEAPEPSPYFDTRMAARLREEKNTEAPGWLERMLGHWQWEGKSAMRPVLAAILALLVIVGVGSFEGHMSFNKTSPAQQTISATVNDLELLDRNAQTLQELAAFDSSDAAIGQGVIGSNHD
ncbi:MAG: hypothetical protein ABI064_07775 [Acidobacteriaceae bacterium]